MKKLLLFFILFSISSFSQERIYIDIGLGPTVGKAEYISDFAGSLLGTYYFNMEGSIQVGGSTGGLYFNAKESFEAKIFAPVSASVKFHSVKEKVLISTDFGYAFCLAGGDMNKDSGIYFRPYIGYQLNPITTIGLSYVVVNKNTEPAFVGINCTFNLSKESRSYSAF